MEKPGRCSASSRSTGPRRTANGLARAPWRPARRELREETGCTADDIEPLISVYTTPGFTDELIHLYLATGLTRGATERDADEFFEVETLPLSGALEMIQRGEIRDAKTVVALLYAAGFRAKR